MDIPRSPPPIVRSIQRPLRTVLLAGIGALIVAAAALVTACGVGRSEQAGASSGPGSIPSDGSSSGSTDLGSSGDSSPDAGSSVDAGTSADGARSDAGSSSDATSSSDASARSDAGSSSGSADAGDDAGLNDDGPSDAGPPVILSLSETVSSITQGDSFTVVAVVTDPRGLSNLVGGELTSRSGAVLGAFVAATPGTYSVTVSWDQLNAAAAITFTGQTSLTNRATFSDAQGLRASQDIPIELYCGSAAAPDAACAGQCVSLTSADTCGSCTASCADAGGGIGEYVSCAAPGVCAWQVWNSSQLEPDETCTTLCASGGGICVSAQVMPADLVAAPVSESCAFSYTSIGTSIAFMAALTSIGCACYPDADNVPFPKLQTGNCASLCASEPGSPACMNTVALGPPQGVGSGATYVYDACSAPYGAVTGNLWDDLVQSDLPADEPVLDQPGSLECQCSGPAP